ncbi:MAG: hypothetical protein ACI4AQ_00575 [Lachnospiraceae bacterium]
MDFIKYSSTYKADGKKYEQIVFWNRFLRNKTEMILSLLPAAISIVALIMGYRSTYLMVIYCILVAYPFLAYRQFRSAVKYHLTHRDAMEKASCDFTLTSNGILCEFKDYEEKKNFRWEDFTTVYDRLGYYMFFNKGDMLVMLNQDDIPEELKKPVRDYIDGHIDHNKCVLK